MKVVIFCGGQGLRMREASEVAPKPMIPIGSRPVLWHVMKYYAHFGFTDFVLCLGYKAEAIKQFFLTYNEAMANDFVLSDGGANVHLLKTDIHNWNITFVDTGLHASIGERLRAVREHLLATTRCFLANYGDTLTDADLPAMIDRAKEADVTASFLAVRPNYSFHVVSMDDDGLVDGISDVTTLGHLDQRRLLRHAPRAPRPAAARARTSSRSRCSGCSPTNQVLAQRHDGFWAPMDTLKDKQWLEGLHESGQRPVGGVGPGPGRRRGRSRYAVRADAAAPDRQSRGARPAACSRSAPIPTTSRSAAAGRCSSSSSSRRSRRSAGWCSAAGPTAPTRRSAAPRRCSRACRRRDILLRDFPDGFFPYEGQRIKDFFEELKARLLARRGLHPPARRPAPGPSRLLRADLEHVPRPPDPRVRGAEVRRRHERAERLRAARGDICTGARSTT